MSDAAYSDIDRVGNFQARIIEYGLKKASESESIAVFIKVHLLAMWNPDSESWTAWDVYLQSAIGDLWIVKKDGTLNTRACESLVKHAGWDGTLEAVSDKTWEPTDCQVKVGTDVYKGTTRYRIDFINGFDSVPGKFEELGADKVQSLSQQFGSQLRALAGTHRTNSTPAPKGKPPAPPKATKAPPPPTAEPQAVGAGVPADEVPFSPQ